MLFYITICINSSLLYCFQKLKKAPESTVFSDMRHMIIPYLALYFVCIWLRSCLDLDEIARGKILERALEASERVAGLQNAFIYIYIYIHI